MQGAVLLAFPGISTIFAVMIARLWRIVNPFTIFLCYFRLFSFSLSLLSVVGPNRPDRPICLVSSQPQHESSSGLSMYFVYDSWLCPRKAAFFCIVQMARLGFLLRAAKRIRRMSSNNTSRVRNCTPLPSPCHTHFIFFLVSAVCCTPYTCANAIRRKRARAARPEFRRATLCFLSFLAYFPSSRLFALFGSV